MTKHSELGGLSSYWPKSQKPKGYRGPKVKLNEAKVITMRVHYSTSIYTIPELAEVYNVSLPTVYDILYGDTWSDVGGPLLDKPPKAMDARAVLDYVIPIYQQLGPTFKWKDLGIANSPAKRIYVKKRRLIDALKREIKRREILKKVSEGNY